MKHLEFKSLLLAGAALAAVTCSSDEATSASQQLTCPLEIPCFHDSTSQYVLYGDAYLYHDDRQGDLLIYKDTRIVTDAKGNHVGSLNSSETGITDIVTGEPIVQMLKLGELQIVTPVFPEPDEDPTTSASGEHGTTYKLLYDLAWVLHADKDYLIYENGEVSDANCYVVGNITDHFDGDIIDKNGNTLVNHVNAADLDVISTADYEACPARPKSSSSSKPASNSSSSKKPESSSSSGNGGGSTPTTGCPNIKTKGGSGSGWATRYWDCCKPSCSWNENSGGKNSKQCTNKGRSENTNWGDGSICSGGSQMTCISQIPFTVSGCNDMGFAFAAVPASNGGQCGKCFQLTFTGKGKYSTDNNHTSIKGKKLIIMVTNVGHDVEQGQFDIMIPGGGVGAFNGCSSMGWGNQGKQYGGLLSDCEESTNYSAPRTLECLKEKCNSVFSNDSDAKKGCMFLADFMHAAGNPMHDYVEVECPDVLKNKY